jgi:hypothetical protein
MRLLFSRRGFSVELNKKIPAFPVPREVYHEGMTLRDCFAVSVLNGLLARESLRTEEKETIADYCFNMADAMLERRKDKGKVNYGDRSE